MTVSEGPGGKGTRIIRTKYPKTAGLTAGTTKTSGRKYQLEPKGLNGKKSILSHRRIVGL